MLTKSDRIFDFISKYFEQKGIDITFDTALIEDGLLDSMEIVDFILALESFMAVEYEPECFEIRNFKSIKILIQNLREIQF
ncbi:acyl carrier protein [Planktomarina temperata]|nr:acyl carrier protein [Planktomarina temperata]